MPKQELTEEEGQDYIAQARYGINEEISVKGEPCHTLAGQLRSRTVADLREVAGQFSVTGNSHKNKETLVQAIAERMVEPEFARLLFSVLEGPAWRFFQKAADAERYPGKEVAPGTYVGPLKMCLLQLYAHDGEISIVVPDELKQVFAALRQEGFVEQQDFNLLLKTYAEAAVSIYGAISQDKLVALFNRQNERKTDIDEMFETLIQYVTRDSDYCFWDEYLVKSEFEENDFEIVEYYMELCGNKPRYIPPKEDLLHYSDPGYYEQTPQIEALRGYLTAFVFDDEDTIEDFINDVHNICVRQLPGSPLRKFFTKVIETHGKLTKQQTTDVMRLMMDVCNNTRMWAHKGHTPCELHETEELPPAPAMDSRAGPNDLCPCGSGKKYKKCCMFK